MMFPAFAAGDAAASSEAPPGMPNEAGLQACFRMERPRLIISHRRMVVVISCHCWDLQVEEAFAEQRIAIDEYHFLAPTFSLKV